MIANCDTCCFQRVESSTCKALHAGLETVDSVLGFAFAQFIADLGTVVLDFFLKILY